MLTWENGRTPSRRRVRSWMPGAPVVRAGSSARVKGQVASCMLTYGARFDVNCSILFTELPLERRAAAARAAGFAGVEFWWPWAAVTPTDKEAETFIRS